MRKVTSLQLGKRFLAIRNKLNYNQKDFAAMIDVSASYLSEIEKGRIKPGFDLLSRLVAQFPVNPYYLFSGQQPMILENKKTLEWKFDTDFGEFSKDINKMMWYMSHSKLIRMQMLAEFTQKLEEGHDLVHSKLKRHGLSYPGEEEDV